VANDRKRIEINGVTDDKHSKPNKETWRPKRNIVWAYRPGAGGAAPNCHL